MPEADKQVVTQTFQPSHTMTDQIWLIVVSAFRIMLVGSFLTLALSVFIGNPNGPPAQAKPCSPVW